MSQIRSGSIIAIILLGMLFFCTAVSDENEIPLNNSQTHGFPDEQDINSFDNPTESGDDSPIIVNAQPVGEQAGWVSVNSIPSGARVMFDGLDQGVTPVQVRVITTASPFHQIFLSMDGYQDWSTSLSENPGPGETIPINAYLVPIIPTQTPTITSTPTLPPTIIPTVTPSPTLIGPDYGWVSIDSIPQGAEVTFDGVFQGSAPTLIQVYTTGTPSHQILVRMAGYYDYISSLSRNPGPGETIPITARLVPEAEYGSIKVTSTPSQSLVILDGGNQDLTPCTFSDITPGIHYLKITKDGYQPYSTEARVTSAGITPVNIQLNPVVRTGTLYVTSDPSGADILMDGIYQGQTPYTLSAYEGYHDITLKLSGYQTWKSGVTIYPGEQGRISGTLTPEQQTSGSVQVASIPGNSAVFLNGNYYGLTPVSGYLDIPDLTPGSYAISITHPQNQDYNGIVKITGGQVSTVNIALQGAIRPSAINGTLSVNSHPSGAYVFLDNILIGMTPVMLPSVLPGTYTVTLRMNDYHDAVRPVTITGGSTTDVMIDMIPVTPVPTEPVHTSEPTPTNTPVSVLTYLSGVFIVLIIAGYAGRIHK